METTSCPGMSEMMEGLTAVGKLMFLGEKKDGNQLPVPVKPGLGRLTPSAQIKEGWVSQGYKPTPLSQRCWSCRSGRGKERGFHCPGAHQAPSGHGGEAAGPELLQQPQAGQATASLPSPRSQNWDTETSGSLGDAPQCCVPTVTPMSPRHSPGAPSWFHVPAVGTAEASVLPWIITNPCSLSRAVPE